MVNTIILIGNDADVDVLNLGKFDENETKILSFNVKAHKKLDEKGIKHEMAEDYLSIEERSFLFDSTLRLSNTWYKNKLNEKEFEIEGINLLSIIDTGEVHQYLIHVMINFLTLKRIIEIEKPTKIVATTIFAKIIESLICDKQIKVEIESNIIKSSLYYDKIEIPFNLGPTPISITISRATFNKVKKLLESFIGTSLKLWFDLNNKNKVILLIEFNPSAYGTLLSDLNKRNVDVLILNRRRPAIWNLESIKILRKSKCKIPNLNKILNSLEKEEACDIAKEYMKKITKLSEDEDMYKIFSLENYSFWPAIKDVLIEKYQYRLVEYVTSVMMIKKLIAKLNIRCIAVLYETGETEKIVLNMMEGKIPTILHQHGFDNLTATLAKYDSIQTIPMLSDKIAVYGDIQKNYLVQQQNIDPKRIVVTGSPRHDIFFKKKLGKNQTVHKTVLITPVPLSDFTGQPTTHSYLKFDDTLKQLCDIIKKLPDVKIIVKLHPSQDEHKDEIKKLFRQIDPAIPVYHMFPSILELLDSCDVLVNIQPESYNTSTVLMESFICEKPTLTIFLDNQYRDLEYIKDGATMVSDGSNLKDQLQKILFDEAVRNELIIGGKKHLQRCLINHGNASEYFAKLLSSYN